VAMDVVSRQLVATKHVSPLVAGSGERGAFIASDALALQPHLDRVVYLEDDHLAVLDHQGFRVVDRVTLDQIDPPRVTLDRPREDTELGCHRHFMAKEMAEQAGVLERLVVEQQPAIQALAEEIRGRKTTLVGCGTALNAALTGKYLFAMLAKTSVEVVPASEFAYHQPLVGPDGLVVALSQSGETVDVIQAIRAARARGARLGAIVNTAHSTLDRRVDLRVLLGAGPEQCVLATKSYTAKVAALLLTVHALRGAYEEGARLVRRAAEGLARMLEPELVAPVVEVARRVHRSDHLFVIGRGLAYPSALEAALKIKEVSYIHAEGFASGELKHGVIALVSEGTPCLVYAPNDETRADVLSGAAELKSRGAYIVGIGPDSDPVFDAHLAVPDVGDAAPIVNALPAQLLGYHTALMRGNDPDRPRNLAKSVTVK
ncbi:MAG TPA: SIS domain-containing protein, partial [Thermomicrobiales bacterium]|nr:SIS domain-containing protein [Thermomicrobiales bacterium]